MAKPQPHCKQKTAPFPAPLQRRLLHYVKLNKFGGVGAQFAEFIPVARQLCSWEADVVACGHRTVHPIIANQLTNPSALHYEKYAGPVKLPGWPSALRRRWQQHLFKRSGADAVLIWNEFGRNGLNMLKAVPEQYCIYWEHGTAWVPGTSAAKLEFMQRIQAVLANSVAAKRMLQLRWNYSGQIEVIHNALRPSLLPSVSRPRKAPGATYRLGFAGRLIPLKGVAIALHAFALIRDQGYDVTLDIAGDGPDRIHLQQLANHLGIAHAVRFRGWISDVSEFYKNIDLLIHPTLQESFGLITSEAHAYGIPTLVTAVDGLVESVADGVSGICIPPTEPLSIYAELGGGTDGIPSYVYNPATDAIDTPRVIAPDSLAKVVIALMNDHSQYEYLSQQAINRVRTEFGFDRHVQRITGAIDNYLRTGELHT